jgi:hypothetical protein
MAWRRYFTTAVETYRMGDERRRQELQMAMEGDAARVTADIDIFAGTFEDVLRLYEEKFITPAGTELAESEFTAARQLPDESVLQFHARCRELFDRAYPTQDREGDGLAAKHLRRQFVWGLANRKVTDYVWDQRPATYARCLELAQAKLSAFEIAKVMRPGASGGRLQAMSRQGQAGEGEKRATKCWGCQEEGHVVRDCPLLQAGRQAANLSSVQKQGSKGGWPGGSRKAAAGGTRGANGSQGGAAPPARGKSGRGRGGRGRGRKLAAMSGDGDDDAPEAEEEPAGNEEGSAL